MRFKLLRGSHQQREVVPGEKCDKCLGTGKSEAKPKASCVACYGTGNKYETKSYHAKDSLRNIVDSPVDLELKFGYEKFQCLDRLAALGDSALRDQLAAKDAEIARLKAQLEGRSDDGPPEMPRQDDGPNLQQMSVKELRKYAEREGIDLDTASTKEEIIFTIESELQAQ